MKNLIYLGSAIIILIFTSCSSSDVENGSMFTGIIEKTEVTTYQYGTHVLITVNNRYALKSETIDLNKYTGRSISLKAEKIQGYPVDGGPEYLNVLKILK